MIKHHNAKNAVLLNRAAGGDRNARDELILNNMGLVYSVVKRFCGRGYEKEDLIQIGSIGLIRAAERFDMSFGVQFSTYAIPMIIGEIKRFIRDDGIIKVSRSLKETAVAAAKIRRTAAACRRASSTIPVVFCMETSALNFPCSRRAGSPGVPDRAPPPSCPRRLPGSGSGGCTPD